MKIVLFFVHQLAFLFVFAFTPYNLASAGGTPDPGTGNSRDNQLFGSFNNTNGPAGGDFVNSTGGLNSNWLYNIEIPPSQTNLTVEIFDADVRGKFAAGEIHDTADANDANGAQATYRLIDPLGAVVATAVIGQDVAFDNTWALLNSNFSVANPMPGHWQLEYDLVSTTSAQGNTYGVRAHDGTSGAGGTEYNMYSPTYVPLGHGEDTDSTNPGNEDQNYYPYITRGCFIDVNDFDLDFDGSYTLTSPTADNFNSPVASSLSGNGLWNQESFTGWASADVADDYGLWELFFDGINTNGVDGSVGQNLGAMYVGDETTANPVPTTNPISNAFRIYLPADGSAYANGSGTIIEPTLPYLTQTYSQSCNTVTVTVSIVNPARANGSTPLPIEFDASTAGTNVITINVPTNGGASSITTGTENPSLGIASVSGNTVTWAPGLVAGATTQTISFDVALDRSFGTGPFTIVDSTQATFVDQTCAGAGCAGLQLQGATVQFGPLCPLSASACDLVALEGTVYNDIDANAALDGADFGLPIITLNLLNSAGNPVLDGMGVPITTMTATDGSYSFENLPAGTYGVSVDTSTLPGATSSNVASPTQTEDPDETGVCTICDSLTTVAITIPIGQTASNIDFGFTGDSLPVTLSSFNSDRSNDKVRVDWSTSSELFNVGFQLWGLDATDSKWEKLHSWLVRSGSGNAIEPQSYSKTIRVPASINELVALGISSIDNDGTEHYYGPFNVGQSYGNLSQLKPIAWDHIRDQVDIQMAARGYIKDRVHGYRKIEISSTTTSPDTQSLIEFRIDKPGIYRITANDLVNAGVDWRSIEQREIALIDSKDQARVRYIMASGDGSQQAKTLGDNGEIYFYAEAPDSVSGIYTEESVYRLVLDRYRALNAQHHPKRGITQGYSNYYYASESLELDKHYSLASAGDDPWLDTIVLSYANKPQSYAAAIAVDTSALWHHDAVLKLGLARSSSLAPVDTNNDGIQDSEHIAEAVVLSDNGTGGLFSLGTVKATGSGIWNPEFIIPANTPLSLIDGKIVVGGLFSAGAGYALSEVQVDSVELMYARPYINKDGDDHLLFKAPHDGALGYEVTVPESGWPMVFAISNNSLVRIGLESQYQKLSTSGKSARIVRFAAVAEAGNFPVKYWASGKRGTLSVTGLTAKTIVTKSSLVAKADGANLLIIAHPAFTNTSLYDYAQFKRNQGYAVAVIDYLEIVNAFGGGQPGPWGLTQYLSDVEDNFGQLAHVLLVGGSSYDHTDNLGAGALTFIPGHYSESRHSKFTVTDSPYVTNRDNQLFSTIGRWPVRSTSDLDTIIANSIKWSQTNHTNGSALVIAEHTVAGESIEFADAMDDMALKLPSKWITKKVYVDDVARSSQLTLPDDLTLAISMSRDEIIKTLNESPDLVLYNGHGTTSQLSNKGLLKASDVTLTQSQRGQMWIPMSCYMTYYESTHVNTLAHQLLFSGKAVSIAGAMLLSSQSENIATGNELIKRTLNSGESIGHAVKSYKDSKNHRNLNINLSILGDPTLSM